MHDPSKLQGSDPLEAQHGASHHGSTFQVLSGRFEQAAEEDDPVMDLNNIPSRANSSQGPAPPGMQPSGSEPQASVKRPSFRPQAALGGISCHTIYPVAHGSPSCGLRCCDQIRDTPKPTL